jgi:hypothetical protein
MAAEAPPELLQERNDSDKQKIIRYIPETILLIMRDEASKVKCFP